MQWINKLKIAIIEKNEQKIEELLEKFPKFNSIEEMKEAAFLMQEAHNFLSYEKEKLASKLVKIKKQQEFISSSLNSKNYFDQSH